MKNKLILLIGASGSGKSTYAKTLPHIENTIPGIIFDISPIILNADLMRGVIGENENDQTKNGYVFQTLERMCEYFLKQGRWLIIDNLNIVSSSRKTWIKLGKKYDYCIETHVFHVPEDVCIERDSKRDRKVGSEIIKSQFAKFQFPDINAENIDIIRNIPFNKV